MKRKFIAICGAAFLVLTALLVAVYPLISNYIYEQYQVTVQSNYSADINSMQANARAAMWQDAYNYNVSLRPVQFDSEGLQAAHVQYNEVLNLNEKGLMGTIEIPKLELTLPIYHSSDTSLENGVSHLLGSALPVGGEGNHCVLTAHSGVAGKRLFSDLDKLDYGDEFYLHILDQTLAYRVDSINTVLPYETELLNRLDGQDLCTLLTCTPFGVNTHRLLVRGHRIPYSASAAEAPTAPEPVESTWKNQYLHGLYAGLFILGIAGIALIIVGIRRKKC